MRKAAITGNKITLRYKVTITRKKLQLKKVAITISNTLRVTITKKVSITGNKITLIYEFTIRKSHIYHIIIKVIL